MDTVFVVRLRSYGFLHPGRERLRTVLKRSWPFFPGSSLYGVIAAALIRLDGVGSKPPGEGEGGYHRLLQIVADKRIRFTPLLPVDGEEMPMSAEAYCQQANGLYEQLEGYRPDSPPFYFTTPHAPLARDTLQIHGDQLYALSNHRACQTYAGFIFAPSEWGDDLQRALRLLPCMPLGGKGKFAVAEGEVTAQIEVDRFQADFGTSLEKAKTLRLLTPVILQDGEPNWLLQEAVTITDLPRLRRYRIWRTGAYYDFIHKEFEELGIGPGEGENTELYGLPSGAESRAATGIPERSRFALSPEQDWSGKIAEQFIHGVGHPNWTYLGWGQVVVEWN